MSQYTQNLVARGTRKARCGSVDTVTAGLPLRSCSTATVAFAIPCVVPVATTVPRISGRLV